MWELSGRELPAQLCFPWQVPSPSSPLQFLMQGIISPNPALCSEGLSQTCQLELCMPRTFPSLTKKLLLPEWPRSTIAPALSHRGTSLLSVHTPKQHHPSLLLQQETQLCVPSPSSLDLRMQLPYLSPALHTLQAQASIMLSCFLGGNAGASALLYKHPCLFMRLGPWCLWLPRSLPQGWGFSLPSSPSWLTHLIKCLAAAACAGLCVSAGTSLAGSREAVPPKQCCEVFAATLQAASLKSSPG